MQEMASTTIRGIFRSRMRDAETVYDAGESHLDIQIPVSRRNSTISWEITTQDDAHLRMGSSRTFEDIIGETKQKVWKDFFMTRVADPTSYFYKYHFDTQAPQVPSRCDIHLVDIAWLKPHEEVVNPATRSELTTSSCGFSHAISTK